MWVSLSMGSEDIKKEGVVPIFVILAIVDTIVNTMAKFQNRTSTSLHRCFPQRPRSGPIESNPHQPSSRCTGLGIDLLSPPAVPRSPRSPRFRKPGTRSAVWSPCSTGSPGAVPRSKRWPARPTRRSPRSTTSTRSARSARGSAWPPVALHASPRSPMDKTTAS
jgi:hypothetical protein